jgi:hypothetical protein
LRLKNGNFDLNKDLYMADNIKIEDITKVAPTSDAAKETENVPEQNPLKAELEKVKNKEGGKTELEKAIFKKNQIEARIKELKGDTEEEVESDDDDAPVTVGMLKKIQQETAAKTALQLTNDIADETERELTKYHLQNSIKSTGNPAEDLNLARAIVNAAKNKQILEEIARKPPAKTFSSSSGAPANINVEQELSPEEIQFTKPPFNMSKAEILKARR